MYFHQHQCAGVPDTFECYNNFTKAISQFPKKYPATDASTSTTVSDRPKRRSKEIDNAGRFPEHGFFCKKIEKRRGSGGVDKMETQHFVYPKETKETLLTAAPFEER